MEIEVFDPKVVAERERARAEERATAADTERAEAQRERNQAEAALALLCRGLPRCYRSGCERVATWRSVLVGSLLACDDHIGLCEGRRAEVEYADGVRVSDAVLARAAAR